MSCDIVAQGVSYAVGPSSYSASPDEDSQLIVVLLPSADFVRRGLDATEIASCFLNPPVKKVVLDGGLPLDRYRVGQ